MAGSSASARPVSWTTGSSSRITWASKPPWRSRGIRSMPTDRTGPRSSGIAIVWRGRALLLGHDEPLIDGIADELIVPFGDRELCGLHFGFDDRGVDGM